MLAGVLIRQFFVLRHKGRTMWLLPAVAVVLLVGLAVALAPGARARRRPRPTRVAFAQVKAVLDARCISCHAAQPTQPGFAQPPKGVVLETPEQIGQNAAKIAETVGNRYMPIGNLTQMTDEERAHRRRLVCAGREALSAADAFADATRPRWAAPADVRAFRGEILDFVGDPATLGDAAHRHFAGRRARRARRPCRGARSGGDDAALAARRRRGHRLSRQADPAGLRRHARPLRADGHHRVLRRAAPRMARAATRFRPKRRFADPDHAREVAEFFLAELLRNGTTTAMVFATTHRQFGRRDLRGRARARRCASIAGKVLMDRNVPEAVRDTAESGYEDSKALIEAWHGRGRLGYAVTPRFAPTSTERQLELCGRLLDEHPGVYPAVARRGESRRSGVGGGALPVEPQLSRRLRSLRPAARARRLRALHPSRRRRTGERMAATGAAMSFCATSNLFLGSGLFDLRAAHAAGVRVGLGTDVGGGTSLSMLRTLDESYKVCQLAGQSLSPLRAFYLATLGGAASLYLDDRIGNFDAGKEADFVVLDPAATPHPRAAHRARARRSTSGCSRS